MLAIYRESRNDQVDTTELDVHLERCASCRRVLAQYSLIGEQLRSLPTIESPPTTYTRLMNALATEHVRYMQQTPAATPPIPAFLKPYVQKQAQATHTSDSFVAFSTAETGPLPIIRVPRKRPHRLHISQFAAISLAVVFLMAMMMSGLTTLLVLTHGQPQSAFRSNNSTSIHQPTTIVREKYTTATSYQHVVSAVADRAYIYYTAYGDGPGDTWMLEQLDRHTGESTPLLPAASASPLIILGSSPDWLVWLQFDPAKSNGNHIHKLPLAKRTWSLHYLSLSPFLQGDSLGATRGEPLTLTSGTFNQGSGWVYTPVQDIWFLQNKLLVAMIDANGISHLLSYQLDAPTHTPPTEIATASPGHVFTSPTATSDGTAIYWSDEWRTDDNVLHSNIWTEQVSEVPNPGHGRWAPHTMIVTQLFRSDGASFYPQIADNTLFLLSNTDVTNTGQATPGTTPSTTPTATAVPTIAPVTPTIAWADPGVYIAPTDTSVHGKLLMLPLAAPRATPMQISGGEAWSPQAGTDFVLWQSDQGYQMFDAATASPITVGTALDGARFLAVNGDTTVWALPDAANTTNVTNLQATLLAFNWPP